MLTSKVVLLGAIYRWQGSYIVYVTLGSHVSFVVKIYRVFCILYLYIF